MTETSTPPALDLDGLMGAPRTDAELAVPAAARQTRDKFRAAAAERIEDTLTTLRQESATLVNAIATVSREFVEHLATADPSTIIERRNPVTGVAEIELTDERGRVLQRRIRALAEMAYDPRAAVHAMTRATHDLRLLADQATEIASLGVSFDPVLNPAVAPPEVVVEAEEVD